MTSSAPSGFDAQLFAAAVRHHQAGQLAEAESLYRRILAADPKHVESLHLLGVLAHQVGRNDIATSLIGQALAVNDRLPECHYNIALAYCALGRFDDADGHFARATSLKPDYLEAHMNLGNVRKQQGKFHDAAACYERALMLAPHLAEAHYNLANVLIELGRLEEAAAECRHALALKPDYAEAHNNLGTVLKSQGKLDEAIAQHRRALELKPDLVEASVNLGNVLRGQGNLDEAEATYRRALTIRPNYAELYNNLGTVFMARGKLTDAVAHFERAATLKPRLLEAYLNLARALIAAGDPAPALTAARCALDIAETGEAKSLFVRSIGGLEPNVEALGLRGLLIRALSEPWARPRQLAFGAARIVKLDREISGCIARAKSAWPGRLSAAELIAASEFAAVSADPLLRCLLESGPVCDVEIEQLFTVVRCAMLELASAATDADVLDEQMLRFYCAIARQCFVNEYVFCTTETEFKQARQLRDSLVDAIKSAKPVPALRLVAVAAYFPLHSLDVAASLLDRGWPHAVNNLLVQQIREPEEERQLRASIPRLTAIEDEVSLLVKQQYEENPYPRWMTVAPVVASSGKDSVFPGEFVTVATEHLGIGGISDILVAGCGTGQQAIEAAQANAGARVLAVDLSLASLGYAKRKTEAMGVENIEYAQADILELGSIARSFDVILSGGVLHHLADPFTGWRVLRSLLRPGGIMDIALYSELGRREVVAAQEFVRERHYQSTAEDIRRCRQELLAHDDVESFAALTRTGDFFSTSECRDMLFHVQEHRLTLPQIAKFIADSNLKFLGFQLDAAVRQRYRTRFPDDGAMTDLDCWHVFETENPGTFLGMYQFWVQDTRQSGFR